MRSKQADCSYAVCACVIDMLQQSYNSRRC